MLNLITDSSEILGVQQKCGWTTTSSITSRRFLPHRELFMESECFVSFDIFLCIAVSLYCLVRVQHQGADGAARATPVQTLLLVPRARLPGAEVRLEVVRSLLDF